MVLKSVLYRKEEIVNKDKAPGAADMYFPFWVVDVKGEYHFALLTQRELDLAVNRAEKNPEDMVPPMPLLHKIWYNILKLLKIS